VVEELGRMGIVSCEGMLGVAGKVTYDTGLGLVLDWS